MLNSVVSTCRFMHLVHVHVHIASGQESLQHVWYLPSLPPSLPPNSQSLSVSALRQGLRVLPSEPLQSPPLPPPIPGSSQDRARMALEYISKVCHLHVRTFYNTE